MPHPAAVTSNVVTSYNDGVGKWKPPRARKKEVTTGSKGRLIGCLVLLVGGLLLFFLLFSAILER